MKVNKTHEAVLNRIRQLMWIERNERQSEEWDLLTNVAFFYETQGEGSQVHKLTKELWRLTTRLPINLQFAYGSWCVSVPDPRDPQQQYTVQRGDSTPEGALRSAIKFWREHPDG